MPPIVFGMPESPTTPENLIRYRTELPDLTPSRSWSSMLSSFFSSDSLNELLPEVDQTESDLAEIQEQDLVMMGPPKSIAKKQRIPGGMDRFEPSIYRCTGYEVEGYEWFSGLAKAKDQRFLIDLEHGTMDRLPDVRPYLYYVGYYKGDRTNLPNVNRYPADVIEGFLVAAGRAYLLAEKLRASEGYFLAERDWSAMNVNENETMPYRLCAKLEPMEGDVGFTVKHDPDYFQEENIKGIHEDQVVFKSNLRSPLPQEYVTLYHPGHPKWDDVVYWLYSLYAHPVAHLVNERYSVASAHAFRAYGARRWLLTDEGEKLYPDVWDPTSDYGDMGCLIQ